MEQNNPTNEPAERKPYDVIVVGAGAAGMMAAGTAAHNGMRVLLLEKMEKSGRKVRITGKGRCNVTNARPPEEFASQIRVNADFFAPAFAEFNNRSTIRFFERRGVKLDIERGEADLSRRTPKYHLQGLSFREFLAMRHGIETPAFSLEDIIEHRASIPGVTHPLP